MFDSKKASRLRGGRWLILFCVVLVMLLQSLSVPAQSLASALAADPAAAPAQPAAAGQALTTAARTEAIQQLAAVLAANYVIADTAASLAAQLRQAELAGRFAHLQTRQQLVDELGDWLRHVSKDGHLGLELTANYGEVTYIRHETDEKRVNNFAFEQVQILPGNIGYLKFNKFVQADGAFAVAHHALEFVSHSKALIIDLRESGGGSPELVRYLLSHFVPAGTLLWQTQNRSAATAEAVRAQQLPGQVLQMPLYLLQSKQLVSAGEFFSYGLQQQGRAVIVGETSAGLAHYTGAMAVTDWLFVRIPLARPLFPKSGDNFEQRGVIPDVPVPAEQALTRALQLAQALPTDAAE